MHTDFVLDALEQALHARQPQRDQSLIHHSDRGSQYVSIRYTERLAEAGIEPSVGSKGDSYDNALAETINGLYKAELIHRRAPWKTKASLELATLEWVYWFNHHRNGKHSISDFLGEFRLSSCPHSGHSATHKVPGVVQDRQIPREWLCAAPAA